MVDRREVGNRYSGRGNGREREGAAGSGRWSGRAEGKGSGEATSSFGSVDVREPVALAAVRAVAKVDENGVEELCLGDFSAKQIQSAASFDVSAATETNPSASTARTTSSIESARNKMRRLTRTS